MLEARHICIERAKATILSDLSLALRVGEVTAICGPNGAGKSTLLSALAGLEAPTAGAITLGGRDLRDIPARERARRIGYLPQNGDVAWNVDVATLARLGRLPWGTAPQVDNAAVADALQVLDLVPLASRPLLSLSGGERARALFARVLAGQPQWILADEPLAALDLSHQLALLDRFSQVAAQGVGVVLVLHDLALAMNHADRVIVLDRGRVAADGPPVHALSEQVIESVWGVKAFWLGAAGARALVPLRT